MNAQSKIETGRMTSKGQILIPKAMRDQAGLKPNEMVKIELNAEGTITLGPPDDLVKETPEQRYTRIKAALRAVRGKYPNPDGMSTDAYMRWLRGHWEP